MKKSTCIFVIICLIFAMLTGCFSQSAPSDTSTETTASTKATTAPTEPTTSPTEETSEPTQMTTPPTETYDVPLLDKGQPVKNSEGLLYVPSLLVESFGLPQMYLFGNALLLTEHRPDANGGIRVFKLMSLEDGSPMAEMSITASDASTVQIGSGQLALCDEELGRITILDDQFSVVQTYELPYAGGQWYIDQELCVVYIFLLDQGLLSWNLETGTESWIISEDTGFSVKGVGAGYLIFEYTDKTDLCTYTRSLNMATGTMETLPIAGPFSAAYRSGNTWLFRRGDTDATYTVITDETAGTFQVETATSARLSGRGHLLLQNEDARGLAMYNATGAFVSACTLTAAADATVGTDFVYSGYWGGYFFIDTWENAGHLMFWNISQGEKGADLVFTPVEDQVAVESVMPPALYEWAEKLSGRFDLDIRIAEQCTLDYSHYEAFAITEPFYVSNALAVLESSLCNYPEGMINQLPYGQIKTIRVELVGGLMAKDGMDTHPADISGFAQDLGDVYIIVLDAFTISQEAIYHELSHMIDRRLEWFASNHTDAAFSEAAWLALQPEGFRYAYSYYDLSDDILAYSDSGYFVNEYSMTFPTEDRATLMAAAMVNDEVFAMSAGLQEKMGFYARCIRESFDTEGWPEMTLWEIAGK